jgi:hypothetical protein
MYEVLTDFDTSYFDFVKSVSGIPNLRDDSHMAALLQWLNRWGCRQFALDFHGFAAENIREWADTCLDLLPSTQTTLHEMSASQLENTVQAFDALKIKLASKRLRDGKLIPVSIGATGASKILFGLRPHALPPWDEPIREIYAKSYSAYLRDAQLALKEVSAEAAKFGIVGDNLSSAIGRGASTCAKLIDEYNWVTITRNGELPTPETLKHWFEWSQ